MNNRLYLLGGLAALLAACGGLFIAQTVAEAFTQFPGDHTVVTSANPSAAAVTTAVPLGANESLAVLANPNTYSVNGSSITGYVGSYLNAFTTASKSRATPQAICVGAANATANVVANPGSQVAFMLHLTADSRTAIASAVDGVCQANGNGCSNSAATRVTFDNKAGDSVTMNAGEVALRAITVASAGGSSSASFQSVKRVRFEVVTTAGAVSVAPDSELYILDLNSAYAIAHPQCLP